MNSDKVLDWDRIVRQHAARVLRVAMRILGNVDDAEDVSQETFTEAFRLHRSRRVHNWTGLLVRLATLRSLDALRRRRTTQCLREDDHLSHDGPCEDAAARELAHRLRRAVAELPQQQAAVFAMHDLEQMSRAEISACLGVSPAAVSTALYKARQRLLSQLATIQLGESR